MHDLSDHLILHGMDFCPHHLVLMSHFLSYGCLRYAFFFLSGQVAPVVALHVFLTIPTQYRAHSFDVEAWI